MITSQPAPMAITPPLRKQETIVFLGDSITQAGILPDGYIDLTARALATCCPDQEMQLIGAGINGHRVPDCQKRLQRDVLQHHPAVVCIYIGVNDVWHWQHGKGTTIDDYRAGLLDIIRRIHSSGAQVILCTPSLIGEKSDGSNRFDNMLEEYAHISRTIAARTGSQLLDLRAASLAYLKSHNPQQSAKGILTSDGVHLNSHGNRFIASLVTAALLNRQALPEPPIAGNEPDRPGHAPDTAHC